MGMANWVVGKMVDAFLAQPAKEKAAVFDTMATKFWEAATPEEMAQIAELLLPRFLEHFMSSATTEQKIEMMRSMLDPAHLQSMAKEMLPDLISASMKSMSPEQWKQILPAAMPEMPGMPGMPGATRPDSPQKPQPKRRPPQSPGGMMPW